MFVKRREWAVAFQEVGITSSRRPGRWKEQPVFGLQDPPWAWLQLAAVSVERGPGNGQGPGQEGIVSRLEKFVFCRRWGDPEREAT